MKPRAILWSIVIVAVVAGSSLAVLMILPEPGAPGDVFENPGHVTPGDSAERLGVVRDTEGNLPDEYVRVTLRLECEGAVCGNESGGEVEVRLQSVNKSSFEWRGLYSTGLRPGENVTVGLEGFEEYRVLVRHPDGRIGEVAVFTPDERGEKLVVRVDDDTF